MNPGYLSMNHLGKTMNRPLYQLVNLLIFILYFANTNGNRYSVITKCTRQLTLNFMQKFFISLFTASSLFCGSMYAQPPDVPTVPSPDTYNISVQKLEGFGHTQGGHAHSPATFEIKIGSNTRNHYFNADAGETFDYNFPKTISLPGFPAPARNFKVQYYTPNLISGEYPLPTAIGGETMVYPSDPGMTYGSGPGAYGYGVTVKRIATNQYTFTTARFECYWCPGYIPTSGTANISLENNNQPVLFPNPGNGYAHLEYNAATNDKFTVRVTDINGKIVHMYTTDLQAGSNRLPVDISNAATGTYFVHWQSATGNTGTLQLIKQ